MTQSISKTCTATGERFEIDAAEQAFIEKVSPVFGGNRYPIPLPTLCPEERVKLTSEMPYFLIWGPVPKPLGFFLA